MTRPPNSDNCLSNSSQDKHIRYREKHRERRRAQSAEWWQKNGAEYREKNREKIRKAAAKHRDNNREKVRERVRKYQKANPEKQRASEVLYRASHPERRKISCTKYRSIPKNLEKEREARKVWASTNKDRLAAKAAKRRATKMQATPEWADLEAIGAFYAEAQKCSRENGIEHHVDHVVPLKSEVVCGLHCPANLQILLGSQNLSKGNRTWPDMW